MLSLSRVYQLSDRLSRRIHPTTLEVREFYAKMLNKVFIMLPLTTIMPHARLPLAMAALLLGASAHAVIPTPLNSTDKINATDITGKIDSTDTTDTVDGVDTTAESLLAIWRQQAIADNLAQQTTWRRLLYFMDDKKGVLARKTNESLINTPTFFLSAKGHKDSAAELDATLVALAAEMTTEMTTTNSHATKTAADDSIRCRFPARVQWLTDALKIDNRAVPLDCPKLDAWMTMLAPEQLSVMFAQEYLDNPISAFGHTLLRIDSSASVTDFNQIQQAYAFNNTVDGDSADNFVLYAIKSAIGSYDSLIEIDPYPQKLAEYLQVDERDTWTYALALTPSEVQQIMHHIWETKDLTLPYYFATDNCASEILRLIDVVRPEQHLLSQLPYVVIPSDVVNLLGDENLLVGGHFTPANNTVRQAQLNTAQYAAKHDEHFGYQHMSKNDSDAIKSADINVSSSMSADNRTLQPPLIEVSDNNPRNRHAIHRAHIGIGNRGDNGYIDVGLRAGFHDTLDWNTGFAQFFDLEGIKATVRVYDTDNDRHSDDTSPKSVVLQNFTLLRGRSFNPVNSAKKGQTWGANIEATRINDGAVDEGTDYLVASTTFERGKSWVFGTPPVNTGEMPPQLCYTLATGAMQAGRGITKGYRAGVGINAGCLYQINTQLRVHAQLQVPYWYHGSSNQQEVTGHYWQPISTFGLQYDIDKRQALRLDASYEWQNRIDAQDDVRVAYMRYF